MDNNNMKYLTVLDFTAGRVFQYEVKTLEQHEDFELFIDYHGHNLSNCEWMVTDNNEIITK